MNSTETKAFRDTVEMVTRELVSAEHRDGFSFIRTPLLFPSGSGVVIRVADAHPGFYVTDNAAGYDEAEMMGASSYYARGARQIADKAGIRFDERAFFVVQVSREQLAGAIAVVAGCALEAATLAAYKLAERRFSDSTEKLYQRLVKAFPRGRVEKDAPVVGRSNTVWHVATLVKTDGRPAIFEPVSIHHSSVFAAATKFTDISKTEDPPSRIAVVRNKAEFKTYLGVLSQSANVVEQADDPAIVLRRLAA